MDDKSLITRCQQGDEAAFSILYQKYSTQALKTAYLITGRKDLAEDIVQETFIKCYKEMDKLKDPQAFKAWFYRILTNLCRRLAPREKDNLSIDDYRDKGIELDGGTLHIDTEIEAKEIQYIVWEAVNKLADPLRSVIVLHYFNDFSVKEIARVMQCFEGTAKSRLHYGRKQLVRYLKEIKSIDVDIERNFNDKGADFNAKASLF